MKLISKVTYFSGVIGLNKKKILPQWNTGLLKKLIVNHLVKFTAFYGT
jgi:hypothetical protein